MLDFLIASLPGALESVVKWALLGSAAVLVLVLLIRRFSTRKALLVRTFGNPAREFHIEGKEIADALRRRLMDIRQVHSGEGLKSAGESTKLGDPRRASENLSAKAISFVASNSTLGFLVGLSSKLWPTLELEGEVVVGEDESLICYSRLKRGGEYFHAWQLPAPERRAAVKECADELACRIVLDTARLGVLAQSEKKRSGSSGERPRSAGTRTWKAFRAMTEALRIWNSPDFEVTDDDQISRVDARLEEAIAHDDGYALAHYNRGTLHCLRFKNAATNAMARSHFERAYELTQEQATEASEGGRTVDYRIEGLAALGLARTYSQDRHRYGRLDEQTVAAARRWANEAIKAMGEVPPALYARAFALHCTETLEDIRKAKPLYRIITAQHPAKFAVVHNNLGYILMVEGELLRADGSDDEARARWKEAEQQLRITLRTADLSRKSFPHANLGNLYRLQGRYDESEREYLIALGPDPEESEYTNGLNELARLYVEMDNLQDGLRFHRLALESTGDDRHRRKAARDLIEFMEGRGLVGKAQLDPEVEWGGAAGTNPEDWVERLRSAVSA